MPYNSRMNELAEIFLAKAEESLAGAESEFVNGRQNNCANRSYYACFQAAIAALIEAGIQPTARREHWGHDFVQAAFIGQLINRQKVYPPALRATLERNFALRQTADYQRGRVSQTEAARAVRRADEFIEAISTGGSGRP
jgi:uncharacterized protein (UPF0332 family)